MELIPISVLKEVSGFRDRRSVARWLEKSLGIQLRKVGRNWCVFREEYERALQLRYPFKTQIPKPKTIYVPQTETEREFLSDLENLLFRKPEL